MKKNLFLIIFAVFCISAGAQTNAKTDTLPVIKFEKTEHDFGKIKEGTLATYTFVFYNTGNSPLVLQNVQASCGCTTPEWTRDPIMPGQKGTIKAAYNSYNRPVVFNKTILVKSNGGADVVLTIKGEALVNTPEPVSPVRVNPN